MSIRLTSEAGIRQDEATAIDEIWMESRRVDVKAPISPPVEWLQFFNPKQSCWKIDEMMLISDS